MSNELQSTTVSRCLEKKILFVGFELADVLTIFLLLALLNLAFGRTDYKLLLVWLPTVALAVALRLAKRGKPDHFLVHWVRFQLRPRVLFAFYEPTARIIPPRIEKRGMKP
jgi:hypothetical protein